MSSRRGPAATPVGQLAPWMMKRLRKLERTKRGEADVALRARMIRMLSYDPCVAAVSDRLGIDRKTVRLWRDRFVKHGLKGLRDKPRSGRPRRISDVTRCELVAMACSRPKLYGIPFRRIWTFDSLHAAYKAEHPEVEISRTSVIRILSDADLRPHRVQGWMHSQDPEFRAKVTHVCGLYLNPPPGAVVLCVDEKTGMQALSRKNPTAFPAMTLFLSPSESSPMLSLMTRCEWGQSLSACGKSVAHMIRSTPTSRAIVRTPTGLYTNPQ